MYNIAIALAFITFDKLLNETNQNLLSAFLMLLNR